MEYNKKLSRAGAVTLPAAMRRDLGIDAGAKFKIVPKDDGSIELKPIQGQCIFCRADNTLIVYCGRFVCDDCLRKMNEINIERSR